MKWSGSKLALLRLCGWAFAEDHVRGTPRPTHPALAGGSSTHGGLKRIVEAVMAGESIDVRAITREVCPGGPTEYADTLEVLTALQEDLIEDPPPFEARNVIHVEERLSMLIGPYTWEGTPDLVEAYGRVCVVHDWKTHWRPMSQKDFEADDQLPRYALLVDAEYPGRFDSFVLKMRFVRYKGAVREVEIHEHDLHRIKWDLATEIEEAEARIAVQPRPEGWQHRAPEWTDENPFRATPGDWCTICSRTDSCPVVQNYLAHGIDITLADDAAAEEVASTVRAIDAHSGQLKRRLKVFLGGDHPTGRVPLAGGSYGFGPSSHRKVDVRDVLEIWEAHKMPLNPHVLRVDVDQLTRSLDRVSGKMRTALRSTIDEYDSAECRYRRGDNQEETP